MLKSIYTYLKYILANYVPTTTTKMNERKKIRKMGKKGGRGGG